MIDGVAGDAFSAITLPPVDMAGTEENEEKIINISRERYASSKDEVEEKIARWSDVIPMEPLAVKKQEEPKIRPEIREPKERETVSAPKKVLYDAVCDTCGAKIQVPFKPDSQPPTFCKECLRDYQSAAAKSENQKESEQKFSVRAKQIVKAEANKQESESERLKNAERKVYAPQEKPITFSQIQHIAPKKFRPIRKKAEPDLKGVRDLIKQNRAGKNRQ